MTRRRTQVPFTTARLTADDVDPLISDSNHLAVLSSPVSDIAMGKREAQLAWPPAFVSPEERPHSGVVLSREVQTVCCDQTTG